MRIIQQEVKEDRDFIRKQVINHNLASLPESVKRVYEEVSFIVRNDQDDIVGGITGTAFWEHMHVDFLWVHPDARGQGLAVQLLSRLESRARELQCRLMIVETFSFQAPGFYRKQGFQEFGAVKDFPQGETKHYFEKRLT